MREFCLNKDLVVEAKEGKRGIPVRKDYLNSVKLHLQNCDEKYRAEAIVRGYGIRIIRLPPYHPELNPIGKLLLKKRNIKTSGGTCDDTFDGTSDSPSDDAYDHPY